MGYVAVIFLTCLLGLSLAETGTLQIIGKRGQNYRGVITIPIKAPVQHGWEVSLQFNEPIRIISSWKAKITHRSQNEVHVGKQSHKLYFKHRYNV